MLANELHDNDSDEIIDGLCRGLFPFGEYRNLTITECQVIGQYYNDYDPTLIVTMLESDLELSKGMRNFIADVVAGKNKRSKSKRSSTYRRDMKIYPRVKALLDDGYRLRGNKEKDGAADVVGREFGEDGETIIKAYQKIKRENEEAERNLEALQAFLWKKLP